MGELTRRYNWSKASLGSPDTWPQSLRSVVGILLQAQFPMLVWWGEERIQFYNDAYRTGTVDDGKHPAALGQKGQESWAETWPVIEPLINRIMAGGDATRSENQRTTIYRNGQPEDIYRTFSFSPVPDEAGNPAGVLLTYTETAGQIFDLSQAGESKDQLLEQQRMKDAMFRHVTDSSPTGLWLSDESGGLTYLNKILVEWTGRPYEDGLGFGWTVAIVPEDQQRAGEAFMKAVNERAHYDVIFRLQKGDGKTMWCRAAGDPYYREDGSYAGYAGFCMDIDELINTANKLKTGEERFRSIFEQAPIALGLLRGRDMVIEAGNDKIFEIWGKDKAITGMRIMDALPEIQGQGFMELLLRVYDTGEPFFGNGILARLMRNGKMEEVYLDFTYAPVKDTTGAISGIMLLATEVTAREIAKKVIEESEARFRSLIEEAPVGTCLYVGRELRIEVANEKILSYWGKGNDVIGKTLIEAMPELAGQPFPEILDHVFTSGKTYVQKAARAEVFVNGVPGTYYFDVSYKPLRDTNGDIYAVLDMAVDVTAQIVAAKELEESEASLRGAIELAQLGTWSIDVATNGLRYSDRLIEWFGYNPAEQEYTQVIPILQEEDQERVANAVARALNAESGGIYDEIYTVIHPKTGQKRILHAHGKTVFDETGKPIRLIGTAQDITMQRELQLALENEVQLRTEQLAASNEELHAINEELAESNDQLLHSNDELAQYAYVASHDLQEPLRKIRVFTEILNRPGALSPAQQDIAAKISHSAARMSALIQDLLAFSRLLKSDTLSRPVNLTEIVEAVVVDFELTVEEKGAVIEIGALPVVEAVSLQMNQLFYNLVSNALKFTTGERTPHIIIKAVKMDKEEVAKYIAKPFAFSNYYEITFTDNGIGFETRYSEQIFEVFKRLHGRDTYPGSGIGLSLCRRIVANQHGYLYAESEVGKGSTFHIILPEKQFDAVFTIPENNQLADLI